MKLRIKGNSLRLRLTKQEVAVFRKTGYIEDTTQFANIYLSYGLQVSESADGLSVSFISNKIIFLIPLQDANEWTSTNRVGYKNEMETGNGKKLFLLLEKDFKCHDNTAEDQSDHYENPLHKSEK